MTQDDVFRLASKSEAGLTEFAATLAVAHCTTAELNTLRTVATQKRQAFESSRSAKGQSYIDVRETRGEVLAFLVAGRDYLKARLGSSWNPLWPQLGFPGPSLEIPRQEETRLHLLTALKNYFVTNPTHENAAFGLTAQRAQGFHETLASRRQVVINRIHDARATREERDAAIAALLKKLRCLWAELNVVLEPLDNRWLKFVDRIPGDPRVPEPVEAVSALAQPGGIVTLDWEDSERAARYRVFKQVVGVDAEPVLALTVDGSDAKLTGVPAGATVRLQVVATNSVGAAPASTVVQLQAA